MESTKKHYLPPILKLVECKVERGFTISGQRNLFLDQLVITGNDYQNEQYQNDNTWDWGW